jgi:DNA mismatch repair protein MutS
MDRFTIRNLELIHGQSEGNHTLYDVLNNTVSPMGARLLKRWIIFPLKDIRQIQERLDAVEFLVLETDLRGQLVQCIRQCGDIERLVARAPMRKINPREVLQVARGLKQVETLKELCSLASNPLLQQLAGRMNPCPALAAQIFGQLTDEPPNAANKPGIIREGVSAELDD